ncbi:MAG: M48 family metallopeptidase [Candidatus Marsarchaeota archaeon]|nr:M48 family metallopeptidase [Candidatus Marsarchaeota archaeon]
MLGKKTVYPEFAPVELDGGRLGVEIVERDLRNGYAMVKDGKLLIKIPRRCNKKRKLEIADELYRKITKSITRRPENFLGNKRLSFYDGERIALAGKVLTVKKTLARGFASGSAVKDGILYVRIGKDGRDFSFVAESALCRYAKPYVANRINELNRDFGSGIGKISVTRGLTIWGSCSPKNNIAINLRLLFMESKFLDYVIIHELCHTKVRSHSKGFWKLVEKRIPGYKKIRRELKSSGMEIRTEAQLGEGIFEQTPKDSVEKIGKEKGAECSAPEESEDAVAHMRQGSLLDYMA